MGIKPPANTEKFGSDKLVGCGALHGLSKSTSIDFPSCKAIWPVSLGALSHSYQIGFEILSEQWSSWGDKIQK
jgi:hypothetical protein